MNGQIRHADRSSAITLGYREKSLSSLYGEHGRTGMMQPNVGNGTSGGRIEDVNKGGAR